MQLHQKVITLFAIPAAVAAVAPETAASIFGTTALTSAGAASAGTSFGSVFSNAGIASSLISAGQGVEQIIGAENEKDVNKKQTEQELEYEQTQESNNLTQQQVNLRRQLGSENAAYGAAGVDVNSGSAQTVQQFSQGQGLLSQALGKYSAIQQQNNTRINAYNQQGKDSDQLTSGIKSLFTAGIDADNKGIFGKGSMYPSIVGTASA